MWTINVLQHNQFLNAFSWLGLLCIDLVTDSEFCYHQIIFSICYLSFKRAFLWDYYSFYSLYKCNLKKCVFSQFSGSECTTRIRLLMFNSSTCICDWKFAWGFEFQEFSTYCIFGNHVQKITFWFILNLRILLYLYWIVFP